MNKCRFWKGYKVPYFTKKNARIFYETYGDTGAWVTLINGYTRPSSDFKLMSSFLAAKGRRVLIFDNRGSGQTQAPSDFTLSDIVCDVVALWDELEISQSHVLGISMGGLIAQFLATEFEQRLSSLCLVSTSAKLGQFIATFSWPQDETRILAHLETFFYPDFARKNQILLRAMAKNIAKENNAGLFDQRAQMQQRAIRAQVLDEKMLSKIALGALIIHGKEDRLVPFSEAERLHQIIPNSHLCAYEQTGHLLLAEQRNDLFKQVGDFFCRGAF